MGRSNKTYRIRTNVGDEQSIHVQLDQDYDIFEILSLNIEQSGFYKYQTSDYGVIVGRVLANNGFGIPNARVSAFIARKSDDTTTEEFLYPYTSTGSKNEDDIRYNLLTSKQQDTCHRAVGTFPEKTYTLDNDEVVEVYDTYYKYTTKTNDAGDYMLFGIPVGNQTIHADVDLSDCGILSQKPTDFMYQGYDSSEFENASVFKTGTSLEDLVQIFSQTKSVNVISYWGDESDTLSKFNIGITRCDINIDYKFETSCVFLGSIFTDPSGEGLNKRCRPSKEMGNMDELTTGRGRIEMIRKKADGTIESYSIQGTELIDGNGVWCYQIPMNLDYMITDEYGNLVATDNPEKGIATRAQVRFRISMTNDTAGPKYFQAKVLVPNNPKTRGSYEKCFKFGTETPDEDFVNLFIDNVYTVKSYIPRIQKAGNNIFGRLTKRFTGIKGVNRMGDNNPLPYNHLRIKLPFVYKFLCAILNAFISIIQFVNRVATIWSHFCYWVASISILSITPFTPVKKLAFKKYVSLNGGNYCEELENTFLVPGIPNNHLQESVEAVVSAGTQTEVMDMVCGVYREKANLTTGEDEEEDNKVDIQSIINGKAYELALTRDRYIFYNESGKTTNADTKTAGIFVDETTSEQLKKYQKDNYEVAQITYYYGKVWIVYRKVDKQYYLFFLTNGVGHDSTIDDNDFRYYYVLKTKEWSGDTCTKWELVEKSPNKPNYKSWFGWKNYINMFTVENSIKDFDSAVKRFDTIYFFGGNKKHEIEDAFGDSTWNTLNIFAPTTGGTVSTVLNNSINKSEDEYEDVPDDKKFLWNYLRNLGLVNPDSIKEQSLELDASVKDDESEKICLVTNSDLIINCMEMQLADEKGVYNFDFYNDWINGTIYIPRWERIKQIRPRLTSGSLIRVKSCSNDTDKLAFSSLMRNYIGEISPIYYDANGYAYRPDYKTAISARLAIRKNADNDGKQRWQKNRAVSVNNLKTFIHGQKTQIGEMVYYFEPCSINTKGKRQTLFATDVVLLGSLTDCNKYGLPKVSEEYPNTTYNLPPRIAESTLNGESYDKGACISISAITKSDNRAIFKYFAENSYNDSGLKNNITVESITDEYGNVNVNNSIIPMTETAGITWNYTGPNQTSNSAAEDNANHVTPITIPSPGIFKAIVIGFTHDNDDMGQYYRPGGHFIGLGCIDQTTYTNIKTSINLIRMCELGVVPSSLHDDVLPYHVPNGLVHLDDIYQGELRTTFASLNSNNLDTEQDSDSGYLKYKYDYLPTFDFGGEFKNFTTILKTGGGEYTPYNDYIQIGAFPEENELKNTTLKEKIQKGIVDAANDILGINISTDSMSAMAAAITEAKMLYTRESINRDLSYIYFRYGGKPSFMAQKKSSRNEIMYYLPLFENSFYFYFGLKDGDTAMDLFREKYLGNCNTDNNLDDTTYDSENVGEDIDESEETTYTYEIVCSQEGCSVCVLNEYGMRDAVTDNTVANESYYYTTTLSNVTVIVSKDGYKPGYEYLSCSNAKCDVTLDEVTEYEYSISIDTNGCLIEVSDDGESYMELTNNSDTEDVYKVTLTTDSITYRATKVGYDAINDSSLYTSGEIKIKMIESKE